MLTERIPGKAAYKRRSTKITPDIKTSPRSPEVQGSQEKPKKDIVISKTLIKLYQVREAQRTENS